MAHFRRLIMADWSAASSPGPRRPTKDRCWVGRIDPGQRSPVVEYCRTRAIARQFIHDWTEQVCASGPVLLGFDFPFGYPFGSGLPGGRELAVLMRARLQESEDDANNRFALAEEFNRQLLPNAEGPFWAHPPGRRFTDLQPTRPKPWPAGIAEHRIADDRLRYLGIQTVWKLAYPASVGSQVFTGMAGIGRLLAEASFRNARIWPFETGFAADLTGIVIAEIWPNLFFADWRYDPRAAEYGIRDAQQVAATLLALHDADSKERITEALSPPADLTPVELDRIMAQEGWIVGA